MDKDRSFATAIVEEKNLTSDQLAEIFAEEFNASEDDYEIDYNYDDIDDDDDDDDYDIVDDDSPDVVVRESRSPNIESLDPPARELEELLLSLLEENRRAEAKASLLASNKSVATSTEYLSHLKPSTVDQNTSTCDLCPSTCHRGTSTRDKQHSSHQIKMKRRQIRRQQLRRKIKIAIEKERLDMIAAMTAREEERLQLKKKTPEKKETPTVEPKGTTKWDVESTKHQKITLG